ncbi:MAG TPA: choice-of-anchor E domain-containing protein [Puia sp.]|nr:choice-of-anchor E domain-containing protein [Puia sp.]
MPMRRLTAFKNGISLVLAFFALMPASLLLHAQCSATLKNVTYSTVLHGTGNNSWGFVIPQFNPSQGTLVAVTIKATISLGYGFSLENNSASSGLYDVSVKRRDSISGSDLFSPLYHVSSHDFGSFDLNASDGVSGSGSDYASQGKTMLLNNYVMSDSIISDVVPFIGTGNAVFNYNPATIAAVSGGASYSFTSSANDTMHFLLTYYYCNEVLLSTNITGFMASKQNDKTIQLSWTTLNELPNRVYDIQKSEDGIHFDETDSISSRVEKTSSAYSDNYMISANDLNRIYFRLKITDEDGTVNYSEIRMVDLGEGNRGIYLYPNPSNGFINILFDGMPGDWQTDIFAGNGQLIQRNHFAGVNAAHINLIRKPASGLYFLHALDAHSQKNYVTSFAIQ